MKTSLLLSLLFMFIACGEDDSPREAPQAVRVTQVRHGPIVQGRSYLAQVAPQRSVNVLAQVQGTVSALPVEDGQLAAKGAYLAHITAPDTMARLDRVRAERERAQQERDYVCGRLETDRLLFQAGDIAAEQLDASEKNCSAVSLAVDAAQSSEKEILVVTARMSERAPFDGVVLEHLVEPGQTVMPGTPLLVFGSAELELVLQVPSTDLASGLAPGAAVLFDGGRGTLSSVGAWAKGPGQLVDLRVAVADQGALPPVGSTLNARLVQAEITDACSVPLEALGEDQQGLYVLMVQDEKLLRVAVVPGPREAGWIAVEPPLEAGSLVVVGQMEIIDMDREILAVEVES